MRPRKLSTRGRAARGFTMIEVVTSATILTVMVFAAFGATQAAMRATSSVVTMDAAENRVADSLTRLRRLLMPASLSTIEGVPTGSKAAVAEPMQANVVYDNARFRIVTGFMNGAAVYEPPIGKNPWQLWFQAGRTNVDGQLMFDDGNSSTALLEHVIGATFELHGKYLKVTLQSTRPDGSCGRTGEGTAELRLALLVP